MQAGGYQTGGFDPGLLALIATLISGGVGGYGYTKYNEEAVNAAKDSLSPEQQKIIYQAQKAQEDAAARVARVESEVKDANSKRMAAEKERDDLKSKYGALAARTAATSGPVVTYQKATPETLTKAVDETIKAFRALAAADPKYAWMKDNDLKNLKEALEYPAIGPGRRSRPSLTSLYRRVAAALQKDAGMPGGRKRRYRNRMRGGATILTEEEFFRIYEDAIRESTISVAQEVDARSADAKKAADAKVAAKDAVAKKADLEKKDKLAKTALEKIASDLAKEYVDAGKILTSAQSVLLTVSKGRREAVKDVANSLISLATKVATVVPEGAGKTTAADYAATERGLAVLKRTFTAQAAGGEEEEVQEGGFSLFKKAETAALTEGAEFQNYKGLLLAQAEAGEADRAWKAAKSNLMTLLPAFKAAVKAYDDAVKKAAKEEKAGLAFTPPKIWMPDMSAVSKLSQSNPFSAVLAAIQQTIENAKTDVERAKNARQAVSDTRTATKTGVDLMKAVVKNAEKALREIDDVLELKGIAAAKAKTGGTKEEYEAAMAKYAKENEEREAAWAAGKAVGPTPPQPDPAAFGVTDEGDGGPGDVAGTAAAGVPNEEEDGGSGDGAGTPGAASVGTEGTESSNPPDVPPASTEECAAVTKLVPGGNPEERLRWFATQLRAILYGKKELAGRDDAAVASADGTTWVPRDLNDDEKNKLFPPGPAEPAERTSSVLDREGKPFTLISMKYVLDKLNTGPFGGVADYLRTTFGKEPTDTYLYAAVAGEGYVVLRCYLTALKPLLAEYTAQYSRFGLSTRRVGRTISKGTQRVSDALRNAISYIIGVFSKMVASMGEKAKAKALEEAKKQEAESLAEQTAADAKLAEAQQQTTAAVERLEAISNDGSTSPELKSNIDALLAARKAAAEKSDQAALALAAATETTEKEASALGNAEAAAAAAALKPFVVAAVAAASAGTAVKRAANRVAEISAMSAAKLATSVTNAYRSVLLAYKKRGERFTAATSYKKAVEDKLKTIANLESQLKELEGIFASSGWDLDPSKGYGRDALAASEFDTLPANLSDLLPELPRGGPKTVEDRAAIYKAGVQLFTTVKGIETMKKSTTYKDFEASSSTLKEAAGKGDDAFLAANERAILARMVFEALYGETLEAASGVPEEVLTFLVDGKIPQAEQMRKRLAEEKAEEEAKKLEPARAKVLTSLNAASKKAAADAAEERRKKAAADKETAAGKKAQKDSLAEIQRLNPSSASDATLKKALQTNYFLQDDVAEKAAAEIAAEIAPFQEGVDELESELKQLEAEKTASTDVQRVGEINTRIDEITQTELPPKQEELKIKRENEIKNVYRKAVAIAQGSIDAAAKEFAPPKPAAPVAPAPPVSELPGPKNEGKFSGKELRWSSFRNPLADASKKKTPTKEEKFGTVFARDEGIMRDVFYSQEGLTVSIILYKAIVNSAQPDSIDWEAVLTPDDDGSGVDVVKANADKLTRAMDVVISRLKTASGTNAATAIRNYIPTALAKLEQTLDERKRKRNAEWLAEVAKAEDPNDTTLTTISRQLYRQLSESGKRNWNRTVINHPQDNWQPAYREIKIVRRSAEPLVGPPAAVIESDPIVAALPEKLKTKLKKEGVSGVFYQNFIGPLNNQVTQGDSQESIFHKILRSIKEKWDGVPDDKKADEKKKEMYRAALDFLEEIAKGKEDNPLMTGGGLSPEDRELAHALIGELQGGRRKSRKSTLKTRRGGKQNVRGSRRRKNRADRSHSHSR